MLIHTMESLISLLNNQIARGAGLFLFALLATACGDELTDGSYPGESRFHMEGSMSGDTANAALISPHVALLWLPLFEADPSADRLSHLGEIAPVSAAAFPSNFDFDLFDLPPEEAMGLVEGPNGFFRMGMAIVFGLDDTDGNQDFISTDTGVESPDLMFGISPSHTVVYVDPIPVTTSDGSHLPLDGLNQFFANPQALTPGFHIAYLDDPCSFPAYQVVDSSTLVNVDLFPPSADAPTPPDCEDPQ